MQKKSSEEWVVVVDREKYILTGEEMALLREADTQGQRGIVWFKDCGISISHIGSAYLSSRQTFSQLTSEVGNIVANGKEFGEIKDKDGKVIGYKEV